MFEAAVPIVAEGSQKGGVAPQKVLHAHNLPFSSLLEGVQLHISSQRAYAQLGCNVLIFTVLPCTSHTMGHWVLASMFQLCTEQDEPLLD